MSAAGQGQDVRLGKTGLASMASFMSLFKVTKKMYSNQNQKFLLVANVYVTS